MDPSFRWDGHCRPGSADNTQDVAFLHDQQVLAVELDLGAGPFAEQDLVARLDVERSDRAVLAARAGADRDDLAFLRLLLGGVGDDDATGRLFLGLQAADQYPVMERTKIHARHLFFELRRPTPYRRRDRSG